MKAYVKNAFLKIFYPSLMDCKVRHELLKKRCWDQEDEIRKLLDDNIQKDNTIKLLNQFILGKDEILLSVQADKNGVYNLVALRESEESNLFEIKIYNPQNGLYSPVCILSPRHISQTGCIFIDDFTGVPNRGLGSIAMDALIKYASNKGINYIKGNIAWEDYVDHIDRLKHFYSKHGFQINLDENNKTGKVERRV